MEKQSLLFYDRRSEQFAAVGNAEVCRRNVAACIFDDGELVLCVNYTFRLCKDNLRSLCVRSLSSRRSLLIELAIAALLRFSSSVQRSCLRNHEPTSQPLALDQCGELA